jgi:hypothetical protein
VVNEGVVPRDNERWEDRAGGFAMSETRPILVVVEVQDLERKRGPTISSSTIRMH